MAAQPDSRWGLIEPVGEIIVPGRGMISGGKDVLETWRGGGTYGHGDFAFESSEVASKL